MKDNANAQEYKREMQNLLNKIEKLQQVVVTRLYTLACLHPEAPIVVMSIDAIKAKSLIGSNRSKEYIKSLGFDSQIIYIEAIEKWIAEQHPHVQLSINYDTKIMCDCHGMSGISIDENNNGYCANCGNII